jgi:autophagy-related protein 11
MHESPAALSSSVRSFQNHTREYIPNIQAATSTLVKHLKAAADLRQSVSVQSQSYLQRLSSAQERMVSIGPRLAEADDLFGDSHESYEILRDVQTLAEGYGDGLLEGFRRGLWKIRRSKRLEKAREEVALWRAQEGQARKAWGDVNSQGGVIWSFVDELSDDETDSTSPISNSMGDGEGDASVTRKHIEMYISSLSKTPLFEKVAASLKERLSVLVMSIQSPQTDVATSPLRLESSDDIPFLKTREGSEVYEQLLRDKTNAEERARNYESRVRNLEEMLHRQFRTPPRNFSPLPTGSGPTSPRMLMDGFDEPFLGRSVIRTNSPEVAVLQKRVQELEREKVEMYDRFTETEGTKSDLMANLEEQTKLFQSEREDLVRKANNLEREVERCETEISRFEELVPKMEAEMDTLRKGRQNLLREMNLLQTESGEKIKELEEAISTAKAKVTVLQHEGENATAETERITGELREVSSAAENAHKELEAVRRLSNEHKLEHERLEQLQEDLRLAREAAATSESEQKTTAAEKAATIAALREELTTLHERVADVFELEKRNWETESLIHAVHQKLAMKEQRLAEVWS